MNRDQPEPQPGDDGADAHPLVELAGYPDPRKAREHLLVTLATTGTGMIEESPVGETKNARLLLVPRAQAAKAATEISAYEMEQQDALRAERLRQSLAAEQRVHPAGTGVFLLWMLALMGVYLWQQRDPTIVEAGASTASAMLEQGELWRAITALFLHADLSHLAGNLLSGLLFSTLLCRSIGPARAWTLMLGGGALGNLLAAAIQHPSYSSSIGASTAVFAALGALSAVGLHSRIRQHDHSPRTLLRLAAPVVAGLILLGWLGGGAEDRQVDVLGHGTGFACGLFGGWWMGRGGPPATARSSRTS